MTQTLTPTLNAHNPPISRPRRILARLASRLTLKNSIRHIVSHNPPLLPMVAKQGRFMARFSRIFRNGCKTRGGGMGKGGMANNRSDTADHD